MPTNCNAAKAVSQTTEPVADSTNQERISVSISKAQEVARSAGHWNRKDRCWKGASAGTRAGLVTRSNRQPWMGFLSARLAAAAVRSMRRERRVAKGGGGDADTLAGLPDAPFDDAATRHLVWTPTDPPAAFAAWFRVLKPGARLLASTRFAVSAEKPPAGQPRRRSRHRTMFQFLCAAGMPGMPPGRPTSVPPVALAR